MTEGNGNEPTTPPVRDHLDAAVAAVAGAVEELGNVGPLASYFPASVGYALTSATNALIAAVMLLEAAVADLERRLDALEGRGE